MSDMNFRCKDFDYSATVESGLVKIQLRPRTDHARRLVTGLAPYPSRLVAFLNDLVTPGMHIQPDHSGPDYSLTILPRADHRQTTVESFLTLAEGSKG